jgi:hypothetical protein
MRLLGVGKTKLNEMINLLIATVPGEFDYRMYDRRFTDRHYYQINYAIKLCRQHGRQAQSILENEGLRDGFNQATGN